MKEYTCIETKLATFTEALTEYQNRGWRPVGAPMYFISDEVRMTYQLMERNEILVGRREGRLYPFCLPYSLKEAKEGECYLVETFYGEQTIVKFIEGKFYRDGVIFTDIRRWCWELPLTDEELADLSYRDR